MRALLGLLVVALLAAVPAHCRHLKWSSPSAGPTQQCIASFNTMVQSGLCSQGSPMPVCCSALAAVGDSCLDSMVAAMEQDPRTYGQVLDITKSLRSQCTGAGTGTGTGTGSSSGPTSQCINDFSALVQSGVCGQGSTQAQCCAALGQVGSACLDSVEADLEMRGAQYAQLLQTTKALRSQCGTGGSSGPVSDPGAGSSDECLNGLMDAFNGACSSVSSCCDALESLGTGCLSWFLEEVEDDEQVHDAFTTLLQSCGMTSSSSTRAAAQSEATTTAVARLQEVGATKLATAPQAARGAAFHPDWHLDAPAAVEQRSAFSQDMLVKA